MKKTYHYRKRLPHIQPPEATYFITYRLFGSIPKSEIEKMKAERDWELRKLEKEYPENQMTEEYQFLEKKEKSRKLRKRYFKKFDDYLDEKIMNEPHWLKSPEIAKFELENIHHYARKYFKLYAVCVMSNHVHVLIKLKKGSPMLWKVLGDMKKYSGRYINKKLDLVGRFWEHESYDHLVRAGEFERIVLYILNNPVKAKLVRNWFDFPFTFCDPKIIDEMSLMP